MKLRTAEMSVSVAVCVSVGLSHVGELCGHSAVQNIQVYVRVDRVTAELPVSVPVCFSVGQSHVGLKQGPFSSRSPVV